jgi:hypothetical protein
VTRVCINPGTGPVGGGDEKQAAANMPQLLTDSGIEGLRFERAADLDRDDGRFGFMVLDKVGDVEAEVQMPGLPLAKVRYRSQPGESIWDFPRIYVNGSSWVWPYAVSILHAAFSEEDDWEWSGDA